MGGKVKYTLGHDFRYGNGTAPKGSEVVVEDMGNGLYTLHSLHPGLVPNRGRSGVRMLEKAFRVEEGTIFIGDPA